MITAAKRIIASCVALLLGLSVAPTGHAQQVKKVGQSTMNFLKVSVSPRAEGMGNANTALSSDAESMFYNPAGLAGVNTGYDVFVANTQWVADIQYTAGAAAASFGNVGTFGVSVLAVDYGDVNRTVLLSQSDPQGYRDAGKVEAGAYAVGLGYARQISAQFSMGAQLQYVTQALGENELEEGIVENEVSKLVGNVGVKFFPGGYDSFRFAMSIRNFSTGVTYEEVSAQMPLVFHVGTGVDLFEVLVPERSGGNSLMLSADFLHLNDYTERVNIGGEYSFLGGLLSLRGGYQFNRDIQGLTAGFGVAPDIGGTQIKMNYSYSDMSFFDGVNRFSLGLSF